VKSIHSTLFCAKSTASCQINARALPAHPYSM